VFFIGEDFNFEGLRDWFKGSKVYEFKGSKVLRFKGFTVRCAKHFDRLCVT